MENEINLKFLNILIFTTIVCFCLFMQKIALGFHVETNSSLNKTLNSNQSVNKSGEVNIINLSLGSFSCNPCKNGEKLKYKICLNVENASKTKTYFVNYSILDLENEFVKKPHIAKIKVKHHRCISRTWTIKTNHEVVFIIANLLNESNGTKNVEKPLYIFQNKSAYQNNLSSNVTIEIPKTLVSGSYNYVRLYVCRGNVRSNTIYLEILKRKGKRYEHLSKDIKIKLNKKDSCYDVTIPVYLKGTCNNENAEIVVKSKLFGKKEKNVEILGSKKFCNKPHICHCSCHSYLLNTMRKEKRKVKKKFVKNESKKDVEAKLVCQTFVNSSHINAKLYVLNNDKPKNCTIRYYVFNKHEPLDLKGWKNEKKVYVRPFEIKIVNLSLNLKNYIGKGKFKVKIICDNKTEVEISKELMIDSSRLNINKSKENETKVKTGLKEKQRKGKLKIKKENETTIRIKNYFENKTEKRPVINAEMIKKRSFTYKLFHLLIKWFNLHHKPIV